MAVGFQQARTISFANSGRAGSIHPWLVRRARERLAKRGRLLETCVGLARLAERLGSQHHAVFGELPAREAARVLAERGEGVARRASGERPTSQRQQARLLGKIGGGRAAEVSRRHVGLLALGAHAGAGGCRRRTGAGRRRRGVGRLGGGRLGGGRFGAGLCGGDDRGHGGHVDLVRVRAQVRLRIVRRRGQPIARDRHDAEHHTQDDLRPRRGGCGRARSGDAGGLERGRATDGSVAATRSQVSPWAPSGGVIAVRSPRTSASSSASGSSSNARSSLGSVLMPTSEPGRSAAPRRGGEVAGVPTEAASERSAR